MAVNTVFLVLFLLSPVLLIIGLIKPTVFDRFFQETPSRKKLSLIFIGATILSFILFGITTDLSNSEGQVKVEEEKQEVKSATISPSIEPSPSPEIKSERTAEQQLVDVRNKINELPGLEEDIFAKCITDKNKTAENIRACQETTQKEIFTLSQDLKNLEKSLLEQIQN